MMSTMTDLMIEREILIDAPAEVVWRTITEPDQITQWFADRVELDARPLAAGSFFFDQHASAQPFTAPLVVETVEPPHRFSFRWSHPQGVAPTRANSVLVEFTLYSEGEQRTRLRVVETGLDEVAWSGDEKARYADDHRHGWEYHFGRLGELFAARAG